MAKKRLKTANSKARNEPVNPGTDIPLKEVEEQINRLIEKVQKKGFLTSLRQKQLLKI